MLPTKKSEARKVEICKVLDRIGSLKFGVFRLSNRKMSPYYVDLRIVPSFPDVFHEICDFYTNFAYDKVGMKNVDRIAGIAVAGIPFASAVAYSLKKPFLYVRKSARRHGRERRIEGLITPGSRVLLIDDLATTGLSLQKAAEAVMAEGGLVSDAVVLIDRQEGAADRLDKNSIRLHALLNIEEIVSTLHSLGTIDDEQLKTVLKQVKKRQKGDRGIG